MLKAAIEGAVEGGVLLWVLEGPAVVASWFETEDKALACLVQNFPQAIQVTTKELWASGNAPGAWPRHSNAHLTGLRRHLTFGQVCGKLVTCRWFMTRLAYVARVVARR